jgi:hypothetical protein
MLASSTYDEHARDAGRQVGGENGASVACDTVERAILALCQSAAAV